MGAIIPEHLRRRSRLVTVAINKNSIKAKPVLLLYFFFFVALHSRGAAGITPVTNTCTVPNAVVIDLALSVNQVAARAELKHAAGYVSGATVRCVLLYAPCF